MSNTLTLVQTGQEYETLKTKIFLETAGVGLVGSVGCGAYDPAYGTSFALGALASLSYIALHARQVPRGPPSNPISQARNLFDDGRAC